MIDDLFIVEDIGQIVLKVDNRTVKLAIRYSQIKSASQYNYNVVLLNMFESGGIFVRGKLEDFFS